MHCGCQSVSCLHFTLYSIVKRLQHYLIKQNKMNFMSILMATQTNKYYLYDFVASFLCSRQIDICKHRQNICPVFMFNYDLTSSSVHRKVNDKNTMQSVRNYAAKSPAISVTVIRFLEQLQLTLSRCLNLKRKVLLQSQSNNILNFNPFPVAGPGFPRGRGTNSPGGRQHTILPKFPKKMHEIERIWTPREGRVPLAPSLRSVNVNFLS